MRVRGEKDHQGKRDGDSLISKRGEFISVGLKSGLPE